MHTHEKPIYSSIKITELPHSEVEIEGEIVVEELALARTQAIKNATQKIELPGFRKGHVPEKVVIERVGEASLLEEAAEIALSHVYPHLILDHKIEVVGRPAVTITKLALGNPLGFKIKVPVYPKFTLPDYKKIAASEMEKKEKIDVTEKELEHMIKDLQKARAADEKRKKGDTSEVRDEELPIVDETFAKAIGNFSSVEEFKSKLKDNMLQEKLSRAKEKKRIAVGEELVAKAKIDVPAALVESEIKKMRGQFEDDLKRMGLKIEDYLKHIKKTEEEITKEWQPDARKRVSLQLVLAAIVREEKITADEKDIERERDHILEHHKQLDKERVADYVAMMLTNEKVFQFLETQK